MATSFNLRDFARRMRRISRQVSQNAETAVQRAAIRADQVAVLATPVDTGRARGGWTASLGGPILRESERTDPSGQATIAENEQTITGWRIGRGPIFIGNAVSYIVFLDEGSSAQAPNGMTDQAIQAARSELARARLLRDV